MNRKLLAPALAGVALLGLAGAASAAPANRPAVMNATVNVRSGPSVIYPIVGKAYAGQRVSVTGCQNAWCYVVKPGRDGWVAARFLNRLPNFPFFNLYLNFGNPPPPPGHGPGPHPGPGPGPYPHPHP